jgi:hypothetical protein
MLMHATCPAHLLFLDSIVQIIFGKVRFQVLTAASMKMTVFGMLCQKTVIRIFGREYRL